MYLFNISVTWRQHLLLKQWPAWMHWSMWYINEGEKYGVFIAKCFVLTLVLAVRNDFCQFYCLLSWLKNMKHIIVLYCHCNVVLTGSLSAECRKNSALWWCGVVVNVLMSINIVCPLTIVPGCCLDGWLSWHFITSHLES